MGILKNRNILTANGLKTAGSTNGLAVSAARDIFHKFFKKENCTCIY